LLALLVLAAFSPSTHAAEFTADVPRGESRQFGWIHVPAGQQIEWNALNVTNYTEWTAEVAGVGIVAADDGGFPPGCVRAVAPFEWRMVVSNTAPFVRGEGSVRLDVRVGPGNASCPTAEQAVAESGISQSQLNTNALLIAVGGVVGVVVAAGAVFAAIQRRRNASNEKELTK